MAVPNKNKEDCSIKKREGYYKIFNNRGDFLTLGAQAAFGQKKK